MNSVEEQLNEKENALLSKKRSLQIEIAALEQRIDECKQGIKKCDAEIRGIAKRRKYFRNVEFERVLIICRRVFTERKTEWVDEEYLYLRVIDCNVKDNKEDVVLVKESSIFLRDYDGFLDFLNCLEDKVKKYNIKKIYLDKCVKLDKRRLKGRIGNARVLEKEY